jgi:hypothetical protein
LCPGGVAAGADDRVAYRLTDAERAGVLATDDERRYRYVLHRASGEGEVWAADTPDGALALWPHPGFVDAAWTGGRAAELLLAPDLADRLAALAARGGEVLVPPSRRSGRRSPHGRGSRPAPSGSRAWRRPTAHTGGTIG